LREQGEDTTDQWIGKNNRGNNTTDLKERNEEQLISKSGEAEECHAVTKLNTYKNKNIFFITSLSYVELLRRRTIN